MRIRPYEQQYSAQGQIQGERATSDSFGGQTAKALDDAGSRGFATSDILVQLEEAKQHVWISNATSDYQAKQMQALQDAKTDPDFAAKYGADGGKFKDVFGEQLKTSSADLTGTAPSNKAQQELKLQLNQVNDNLMGHAIAFQAETGGAYVKTQFEQSLQTDAKLVMENPQLASSVLDRGKVAIAKLPLLTPDEKSKLLETHEQNIALAAGMGQVIHQPEKLLAAIAPDVLASFKPTDRVLANTKSPVTSFGTAKVVPAVEKYNATILEAAATTGVDANFMKAQLDQESKGNPAAMNMNDVNVTGSPSIGIAQFQPATAARYGIDPKDPEQAIKGQAAYMSDLLKMFGGDYRKAAAGYNWGEGNVQAAVAKYGDNWFAHAPASTQNYINEIFKKANPNLPANETLAATAGMQNSDPSRAATNPDWFNKLDWKQQVDIINSAEQGVRANQVRDAQTLALQKAQQEAAEKKEMNEMFDRIGKPDSPLTVAEIRGSDLSYENKEHMLTAINKLTRDELKTDPAVFNDVLRRATLPDGDPDKLTDDRELLPLMSSGKLSIEDANKLRGEISGQHTAAGKVDSELKKNFFTAMRKQIDGTIMAAIDQNGSNDYYRFSQFALAYMDEETRKGTPISELLNPQSKKYMGVFADMFKGATAKDKAQNVLHRKQIEMNPVVAAPKDITTSGAPKIKPGESAAEFLKRTAPK